MYSCQEIIDLLTEYIDGDLNAAEKREFERHIADCAPCRAFLRTYRKSDEIARTTLEPPAVPVELQRRVRSFLRERLRFAP